MKEHPQQFQKTAVKKIVLEDKHRTGVATEVTFTYNTVMSDFHIYQQKLLL